MDGPLPASRPPLPDVRRGRWWNAPWFDALQFTVFVGALLGLAVSGAMRMGYNWQWYRVPETIFEVCPKGSSCGARWRAGSSSPWNLPAGASSSPSRSD